VLYESIDDRRTLRLPRYVGWERQRRIEWHDAQVTCARRKGRWGSEADGVAGAYLGEDIRV
jgi:hypothetical protein